VAASAFRRPPDAAGRSPSPVSIDRPRSKSASAVKAVAGIFGEHTGGGCWAPSLGGEASVAAETGSETMRPTPSRPAPGVWATRLAPTWVAVAVSGISSTSRVAAGCSARV
jgi:hypothetical protein